MTPLRLPLLEAHRSSLEKCVYCPKLCRAACPVSNVEANETVTPWGKMSMAYFAARGDVPLDAAHADPAWACTGCFGCRERCDHKNDVATVLGDARAELFDAGAAPDAARRVSARWSDRAAETAQKTAALGGAKDAPVAVMLGCGYVRRAPDVAADALEAAGKLTGKPVRPLGSCCGLPLLHAGDRRGFVAAARALASELREAREIVAVDPGCARTLLVEYPRAGVTVPEAALFVDLAAAFFRRSPPTKKLELGPIRYHDPCHLGRGLGRYDEPREALRAMTGAPPEAFLREREMGECSGAGGLLPATRPHTSRTIADRRIAEHRERGGGTLVTACAQSLHRFRTRGEPAVDLASLVARALREQP